MRDNSAEYTLTTDAGTFTFTRSTAAITRLKDIQFGADLRTDITPRAQAHGAYRDPSYKAGGRLAVSLRTRGSGASVEASRTSLIANLNAMLESGSGTLSWTNNGGADALYFDNVFLLEDPQFAVADAAWDIQVLLGTEKPFAETQTATTSDSAALSAGGGGFAIPLTIPVTFTPSSGGEVTVTHSGDFPWAYPLLKVYGPIQNPIIMNQSTSDRLSFTGSVANGDYWEVNLWERTVLLNGTTRVLALDALESTWFGVGIGSTTLQLAGSGYSGTTKLRAVMRSSWA